MHRRAGERAPAIAVSRPTLRPTSRACRCLSRRHPQLRGCGRLCVVRSPAGRGRFWRAVDFHPGDHDVEDGDSGHGNVPSGIIGHFPAKTWWTTTAASDRPTLGAATFVDLAAHMWGYRRRRVRRENGRRTDYPEPVSHSQIHSAPQGPNNVSALGGRATEASCQSLSGIPVDTGVCSLCKADVDGHA